MTLAAITEAEARTMEAGAALQRLVRDVTGGRATLVHWEMKPDILRLVLQRKEDFIGHQVEAVVERPSIPVRVDSLWQNLSREILRVVPNEEEFEAVPI